MGEFYKRFLLVALIAFSGTVFSETFEKESYNSKWAQADFDGRFDILFEISNARFSNSPIAHQWMATRMEELFEQDVFFPNYDKFGSLFRSVLIQGQTECIESLSSYIFNQVFSSPDAEEFMYLDALSVAAHYAYYFGNNDSLEVCIQEMETKYDVRKFPNVYPIFCHLKALYLSDKAQYFNAIILNKEALSLTLESDLIQRIALNNNLADLYLKLEDFNQALSYAQETSRLLSLTNIRFPGSKEILAIVKMRTGDLEGSLLSHFEVYEESRSVNDSLGMARSLSNRANVLRRMQRFEEAMDAISESNRICEEMGVPYGIWLNMLNESEIHLDLNNPEKALALLDSVTPVLEANRISFAILESKRLYASTYKASGDFLNAYDAYASYIELRDSLVSHRPQMLMAEYESNLARIENDKIREEAEFLLNEEQLKSQNVMIVVGLLSVIVVLIFLMARRRLVLRLKSVQNQQVELLDQLEVKNKELTNQALKLASFESFKSDITEKLEGIVENTSTDGKARTSVKDLKGVLRSIKQSKQRLAWHDFERRFLEVHTSFYDNLLVLAPTLSPSELRICALLKLNLTTKEIAEIANRSTGTIDNTRARIRKKLKLSDETSLTNYIISL